MEYIFIVLGTFIALLFLLQLGMFEITRNKMLRSGNVNWFLSLKKPFNYNRVGYMTVICLICYLLTSPEAMFSMGWFIYFVIFLAVGIISDAIVQYLILVYSKRRCKHEIENAAILNEELEFISQNIVEDTSYEESESQYDMNSILQQYVDPADHLAILSVDNGEFALGYEPKPEATFVVEPYSDMDAMKHKFSETQVKVTKLTSTGQMPFKDEKMDIVLCEKSNYDKLEVERVLKPDGYFLVSQNGTANLKEFLHIYVPFGMKGSWDAYSCAGTLNDIGMRILDKKDDYGTVRFHNIQSIYSYFKKVSPEFANIKKYQIFYLKALKEIKERHFYEMTTHKFYVVAQRSMPSI